VPSGNITVNSKNINNLADPVQAQDAASKSYVDSIAQGLDPKASVYLATTGNIFAQNTGYTYNNGTSGVGATLTAQAVGNLTIDGSVVTAGERILIKNEVGAFVNNTTQSAAFNGIYVVTTAGSPSVAYVLTRATDFDNGSPSGEIPSAFTFVEHGTTQSDTGWVCTTNAPVTVGTTQIIWVQFSGAGSYTAGNALSLSGTQFNVNTDSNANPTIGINGSNQLVIPASAVLTSPNIGAATGTSLSVSGNITGGNILGGANVNATTHTGTTVSVTANITGGNLVTGGLATVTGNITGGNLVTAGLATITGNVTGGNLITAGLVTATGNITSTANVSGGNLITAGIVTATGNITSTANVSGGNLITSGLAIVTGNITGGNISTAGLITATGGITSTANVTGGNLVTAGLVTVTGNITGGNISTAGLITATGNIAGGNLTTAGLITATGNIAGGNLITGGLASVTGNITGGNLTTGGTANVATLIVTSFANITSATTATSTLTGAVRVAGGVGVVGNVYAGGMFVGTDSVLTVSSTIDGGTY
jgi:hypothetical protein